ncbi:CRISPR system precrRNA processing endoribonuclease RAMP protein Cas6 [Immundisolibacter sp.]|uniref:CRISPR system precrRNA processing endoribonuclease RAMP protein Cas6 n=1 Tax=Immundisolibacter sp. TaxID=1934948 RepID=UPI003F85876D
MEPVPFAALTAPLAALPVARYRLHLTADTAVRLPAYAGSTWRGALGHALRRTVCVTDMRDCPDCLLYRSCVYPYVFETPPPERSEKLRKYPAAPHPFVIEPWPDCREVAPGDAFGVDLVLIGRAQGQLAYFIEALRRAGQGGIGKGATRGEGRYVLTSVEQEAAGWQVIYTSGGRLEPQAAQTPAIPPLPAGRVRVELSTPLRLKVAEDLVTPERLRFRDFFSTLLRRLSLLSYFHTDTPLDADFRTLVQAAEVVALSDADLQWHDWTRYSARQDALLRMGGLVGTFTLPGAALAPFWSWLWLGQWTHAGKGAVMGLGRYRLIV